MDNEEKELESTEDIIDDDNGEGFSRNIKRSKFKMINNGNFIVFSFKKLEDNIVSIISYVHAKDIYDKDSMDDLKDLLWYYLDFCLGNHVDMIYFKQKSREHKNKDKVIIADKSNASQLFDSLEFSKNEMPSHYKFRYTCKQDHIISTDLHPCKCRIQEFYI